MGASLSPMYTATGIFWQAIFFEGVTLIAPASVNRPAGPNRDDGGYWRMAMGHCDVCGNEYDKTMQIKQQGRTGIFDSFECAINAMAPTCTHCGCRIIGHGVEADGKIFCCAHCARTAGVKQFRA